LERDCCSRVSKLCFFKIGVSSFIIRWSFHELLGKTRLNAIFMEPDPRFLSNLFQKTLQCATPAHPLTFGATQLMQPRLVEHAGQVRRIG
jgi:hypothetical protein